MQTTVSLSSYNIFFIHLTYNATLSKYNNIEISYSQTSNNNITSPITLLSSSISGIGEISSLFSYYLSTNSNIYYIISSNYDLSRTYLNYTIASSIGYQSGWAGDTSGFSTYPIISLSKPYTNGYSGSYNIDIPNYLASGTGFSIISYISTTNFLPLFRKYNSAGNGNPFLSINENGSTNSQQAGAVIYGDISPSWGFANVMNSIKFNNWNNITVFNNNGTIRLYVNGSIGIKPYSAQQLTDYIFSLYCYSNVIIASIAYTKSPSVSYPFNQDNNVISYVDFADPNNPVVYGDTSQLVVTGKSLTSATQVSNLPDVLITSKSQSDIISLGGTYCITPGQSISYTLTKSKISDSPGYYPSTVILSSPMIGSAPDPNNTEYPSYTNGYSGAYGIEIPNYLASGSGVSMVFYIPSSNKNSYPIFSQVDTANPVGAQSTIRGTRIFMNVENTDPTSTNYGSTIYSQYSGSLSGGGTYYNIGNDGYVNYDGWNNISIFNSNGTLYYSINGNTTTYSGIYISQYPFGLLIDNGCILASIAYTKSPSVSYPFNQDNNVISYVDFADPNNPVVYGDTSQLVVTGKSLTSTTQVSNLPDVLITDKYAPNVTPYIYKKYTNGYSGSYNIEIPNYLASGSGISIVSYITNSNSMVDLYHGSLPDDSGGYTPSIVINDLNGSYTVNESGYYQYDGGLLHTIQLSNAINYESWNQFTIFNDNGTLTLTTNSVSGTTIKTISDTEFKFLISQYQILAGIAYINSNTIPSYPFDKESNVISYIDFSNPSSPTIYGDKTQFNLKNINISSISEITNIPDISITSMDLSEMAEVVKTNGGNNMFFLYTNPMTNSNWTNGDISSLQFGLTKIS